MAKKRILSWLAAASLALSLLPAAALAADGDPQSPSAQQTLEAVKEAAKDAAKAEEDAVEALGNTEDAKEKIEEIAKDLSSDNDAVDRVNETYDEGLEAETIVDAANEAIEEEAEKIDSDIDLSDPDAVSDAVNAKIDSADQKAQEALDAVVKADNADEASKSLAQKAAEAVETAKNLAGSVTADSGQEAIRDAAEKAQNAADIARDAADIARDAAEKAKEAVDSAESAYTEAINAAKEALEAAKNIDGTLNDQERITANDTVKTANEVTRWVEEMEPKAGMTPEEQAALKQELNTVLADTSADQLQKDLAQATLNYITAQEEAARAAAEAGKAQTAANEAKTEKNLSAVTSVLDVERENLLISENTNEDAVKTVKDQISNAGMEFVDNAVETYKNSCGNRYNEGSWFVDNAVETYKNSSAFYLTDASLVTDFILVRKELLNNGLELDDLLKIKDEFDDLTKVDIIKRLGIHNAAKDDIGRIDEKRLLAMLNARIEHQSAVESVEIAKDAAEAIVDAQVAQQKADTAKSAADKAFEDYKNAKEALIERERLNELHQQAIDLAALQNKLDTAEKNWQDAKDAADQAQKDADDAQEYADQITDLIDGDTGDTDDTGDTGDTGGTGGTGAVDADDDDDDDDGATIEDGIVPLALMPTRGELMNYLYVRAGSPAAEAPTFTDVPASHEFAQAIGWAQANGIAAAYEDGTFDPDNFVIAADLTVFLANYAKFSGMTVSFPLSTMAGLEDDAIVENADEILAQFFGA